MTSSILQEIQLLNPDNVVEVYELDATAIGGDITRFHPHAQTQAIVWQGYQFDAWPIEAENFQRTSDKPPTPTLRVANTNGSISALCIFFDDMVGATIRRRRTLKQFLDAVNFAEGNPTADPTEEFPMESWFIERKSSETREQVEFELSSALDFNGVQLPRRQIVANNCTFEYRGAECGYTGGAVATIKDEYTDDITQDRCGKRLKSCKLRNWFNGELPYGGFPAAGLMRT